MVNESCEHLYCRNHFLETGDAGCQVACPDCGKIGKCTNNYLTCYKCEDIVEGVMVFRDLRCKACGSILAQYAECDTVDCTRGDCDHGWEEYTPDQIARLTQHIVESFWPVVP